MKSRRRPFPEKTTLRDWTHNATFKYGTVLTELIRFVLDNLGPLYIKPITSRLLTTDYRWQANEFIITLLDEKHEPCVVVPPRSYGSSLHLICVLDDGFLAHCDNQGVVADIVFINRQQKTLEKVEEWDLGMYWTRTVTMGRISSRPEFGCSVSVNGSRIVFVGPSENRFSSWGCKMMDGFQKKFVKNIRVKGFSWVATCVFHKAEGFHSHLAMICCSRFEYTEDYSRPNTTGTLLLYDIDTDLIRATLSEYSASTEVLKFNRNGSLLITRSNFKQSLLILDALTLQVLKTIPHDVRVCLTHQQYFRVLYPIFPLFAQNDREMSILQWNTTTNSGDENGSSVIVQRVVLPIAMLSLKQLCRQTVLDVTHDQSKVDHLPIPTQLKSYLQNII